MKRLMLVCALLLAGCAGHWTRNGDSSQAAFNRDSYECDVETGAGRTEALRQADLYRRCMALRGWRQQ